MTIAVLASFAPLFALVGALINGFYGRKMEEPTPGYIGAAAVGAGFFVSCLALLSLLADPHAHYHVPLWPFLQAGDFSLDFGFLLDTLSVTMMLIITGVGLLIHIYSIAYMHGDEGYSRYFMALNLFVASMLVLVMADSFPLMFIGWEGVGVCSYLLIGFWYRDRVNTDAARKAFITNRVGDVGFLLAMFLTFFMFGSLNILQVSAAAQGGMFYGTGLAFLLGLLFLVAATGKSAQLPLHVWLPDAMAGPTPVSALIHAATMVTAGVYLVARAAPIFILSPAASALIAWVGALTALMAAIIALTQKDIKRILAYSTISQLGYMFVAVGAGAYWVGIFHVFTHAFFKALLFLTSGSVIHALGGEQDIHRMGGLGKHMKLTGTTALIGTLAISGVPFLSGFFSKDAILASTLTSRLIGGYGSFFIYLILLVTAGITAFYMFRWYYLVFAGEERLTPEAKEHLHESPQLMTTPLLILAFFSVFAGYFGLPEFAFHNLFAHWLEPSILLGRPLLFNHPPLALEWLLLLASVAAAGIGLFFGYSVYHTKTLPQDRFQQDFLGWLHRQSERAFGFDEMYRQLFIQPGEEVAYGLAVADHSVVDPTVKGAVMPFQGFGELVTRLQSGFVRLYALAMFVGLVALLFFVAFGVRA